MERAENLMTQIGAVLIYLIAPFRQKYFSNWKYLISLAKCFILIVLEDTNCVLNQKPMKKLKPENRKQESQSSISLRLILVHLGFSMFPRSLSIGITENPVNFLKYGADFQIKV